MKKAILFLTILFLSVSTGFAQNLPSWAEPSDDREHSTERIAPDTGQREGLNGLSGGATVGNSRNSSSGGESDGNTDACNGIVNSGGSGNVAPCRTFCEDNPGDIQCRRACAEDSTVNCSEPILIDNLFVGFLVALGLVYVFFSLWLFVELEIV